MGSRADLEEKLRQESGFTPEIFAQLMDHFVYMGPLCLRGLAPAALDAPLLEKKNQDHVLLSFVNLKRQDSDFLVKEFTNYVDVLKEFQ